MSQLDPTPIKYLVPFRWVQHVDHLCVSKESVFRLIFIRNSFSTASGHWVNRSFYFIIYLFFSNLGGVRTSFIQRACDVHGRVIVALTFIDTVCVWGFLRKISECVHGRMRFVCSLYILELWYFILRLNVDFKLAKLCFQKKICFSAYFGWSFPYITWVHRPFLGFS